MSCEGLDTDPVFFLENGSGYFFPLMAWFQIPRVGKDPDLSGGSDLELIFDGLGPDPVNIRPY